MATSDITNSRSKACHIVPPIDTRQICKSIKALKVETEKSLHFACYQNRVPKGSVDFGAQEDANEICATMVNHDRSRIVQSHCLQVKKVQVTATMQVTTM